MESKLKKIGDGIFTATEQIVCFDQKMVSWIKKCAASNSRKRARVCAHKQATENLHEMLIAIGHDSYIRPHKHINKTESFHVIDGCADVVVFSDNGDIDDVIELGYDRNFFCRLDQPKYHSLLITSPMFVIHEVTNGPFIPNRCCFAPFAPTEETSEVSAYSMQLKQSTQSWKEMRS